MMLGSDAIQGWHRRLSLAGKSTHTPQPDNAIRALVNDLLSAALALLLCTLPDLARKIQTTIAVRQPGLIVGEFADHAATQQSHSKQPGENGSRCATRSPWSSAVNSGAEDWLGWLARQSASPVVAGVA